jgi:hypothetical protein
MSTTKLVTTAVFTAACVTLSAGAEFATYSNNFDADTGNHFGTSFVTTHNGHSDLQLVSDGQSGAQGTWTTGSAGFANRAITSFSATFDFSFNTNGNGGLGDGFSFLFGDLRNMDNNRWAGGEGGVNAFYEDGLGMSIGFDTYGGDSVKARWGANSIAESIEFGSEWWEYAREESYDAALNDANQGNIIIQWDITQGLQVLIDWGGDPIVGHWDALATNFFTWPDGTDGFNMNDWSFGFAGRNGAIDNDILIDNLNIDYNYNQVPAPGALALLGLAGIAARRRRG